MNRAQKKKLFVAMMIIMMIPVLALGQGSFEILPDNVWPKVAEQPPECEHLYGEPILFATEGFGRILDTMSLVSMYQPNLQAIQALYDIFSWVGAILFALSIVMTVASGIVYIVQNRKVFSDK